MTIRTPHSPTGTLLTLAAAIFVVTTLAAPTAVWADDGFCQEEKSAEFSGDELSSKSMASTSMTSEWSTPCQRNRDMLNYNICFEATPYPHTTVPEWIAKWQAEEAVAAVFEQVNQLHAQKSHRQNRLAPLERLTDRAWIAEVFDQMQNSNGPAQNICVEASDENCHSLPPATALVSMASFAAAERAPVKPEMNPPTRAVHPMQSVLVDLRVGPSLEYRRLPERPPAQLTAS